MISLSCLPKSDRYIEQSFDLSMQYLADLKHNEIKINQEEIIELTNKENIFYLKSKKNEYSTKTVLVCTGTRNKYLNFKNEEKYYYAVSSSGLVYRMDDLTGEWEPI